MMAADSETAPIHTALARLRLGTAVAHGALTVIPLLALEVESGGPPREPDWLTCGEAGALLVVTETTGASQVPVLSVGATGEHPVLLLDGEELGNEGRTWILTSTVVVAPGQKVDIPSSRVKPGRWACRTSRCGVNELPLSSALRSRGVWRVTVSVRGRAGGTSEACQSVAWTLTALRATAMPGAPASPLHDFHEQHVRGVDRASGAFPAVAQQVGALVYAAGRWLGLDMLAGPRLFAGVWPRLIRSYVLDAIERTPAAAGLHPPAESVLDLVAQAPAEQGRAVGLGHELRLASERVHGAALVVDGVLAHLAAFPVEPPRGAPGLASRGAR